MSLRMKTEKAKNFLHDFHNVAENEIQALRKNISRHFRHVFEGRDRKIWRPENFTRNPIFTLHGYMQGEASLMDLEDFLDEKGFNVDNTPYPFYRDLRFVEDRLTQRIIRAHEITGRRSDIIGHSTGALIAVALACRIPEHVDKVISIAIPESGSEFAIPVWFLQSGRQLLPWNNYVKKLLKVPFPEEVNLYVVHGNWDPLVTHKFSFFPRGAKNIHRVLVKSMGHLSLIESEIFPLIYDILSGRFKGGDEVSEYNPWQEKEMDSAVCPADFKVASGG
jgi:pimeloyl-ACP methyl ester carboxylesterase